jgi:hypothetical protein
MRPQRLLDPQARLLPPIPVLRRLDPEALPRLLTAVAALADVLY